METKGTLNYTKFLNFENGKFFYDHYQAFEITSRGVVFSEAFLAEHFPSRDIFTEHLHVLLFRFKIKNVRLRLELHFIFERSENKNVAVYICAIFILFYFFNYYSRALAKHSSDNADLEFNFRGTY